ncbi:MAG: hypothetical protein H8D78_16475 [Chloroflexi bacterium]|nr:hypothetical protein [Chloroflexota bacterium]
MVEEQEHLHRLLEVHCKALQTLELQAAKHGLVVPLEIETQIEERREQIADLEARLAGVPEVERPDESAPDQPAAMAHLEQHGGVSFGIGGDFRGATFGDIAGGGMDKRGEEDDP